MIFNKNPSNSVLTLVSGGFDSLTILNIMKSKDIKQYGLIIDYGYPQYILEQAESMAKRYCYKYEVVKIGRNQTIFKGHKSNERNLGIPYNGAITLAIGSMVAETEGIDAVVSGLKKDAISNFDILSKISSCSNLYNEKSFIFPLKDDTDKQEDCEKQYLLLRSLGVSKEEILKSILCLESPSCGYCRHCKKAKMVGGLDG